MNVGSKQGSIIVLISDKICFKPKQERKDKKKDHLRLIKGTRHDKDITILNMSVPNTGALNFIF